ADGSGASAGTGQPSRWVRARRGPSSHLIVAFRAIGSWIRSPTGRPTFPGIGVIGLKSWQKTRKFAANQRAVPDVSTSAEEQRSSVLCGGPDRDGAGGGHAFLGGKSLQPLPCAGSLTCWRCNPGSRARSSGKDRIIKGD